MDMKQMRRLVKDDNRDFFTKIHEYNAPGHRSVFTVSLFGRGVGDWVLIDFLCTARDMGGPRMFGSIGAAHLACKKIGISDMVITEISSDEATIDLFASAKAEGWE